MDSNSNNNDNNTADLLFGATTTTNTNTINTNATTDDNDDEDAAAAALAAHAAAQALSDNDKAAVQQPRKCRICGFCNDDDNDNDNSNNHSTPRRAMLRFLPVTHDAAVAAAAPGVTTFGQDVALHIFCGKTASILPHVQRPDLEILTKAGLKNKHGIGPEVNAALARTRCAIVLDEPNDDTRQSSSSSQRDKQYYLVREFEAHLAAIRHTHLRVGLHPHHYPSVVTAPSFDPTGVATAASASSLTSHLPLPQTTESNLDTDMPNNPNEEEEDDNDDDDMDHAASSLLLQHSTTNDDEHDSHDDDDDDLRNAVLSDNDDAADDNPLDGGGPLASHEDDDDNDDDNHSADLSTTPDMDNVDAQLADFLNATSNSTTTTFPFEDWKIIPHKAGTTAAKYKRKTTTPTPASSSTTTSVLGSSNMISTTTTTTAAIPTFPAANFASMIPTTNFTNNNNANNNNDDDNNSLPGTTTLPSQPLHSTFGGTVQANGKVMCGCGGLYWPASSPKGATSWRNHVLTKRHVQWMEEQQQASAAAAVAHSKDYLTI